MTTPPSPPNRRRRRIIVTVAVLALALSWWLWPSADQRFVGKWWFENETNELRFILDLRSDGRGSRHGVAPYDMPFAWNVRGREFIVGSSQFNALPAVLRHLIVRLRSLLKLGGTVKYETFEVVELEPARIRMVSKQNGHRYKLTPYDR
jgi:hypothetical protein